MYKYLIILFASTFVFYSCEEPQTYSDIPQIEFISFSAIDSALSLDNPGKIGFLRFSFKDGDGDIGHYIKEDDESGYSAIDTSDLFLIKYIMVNNVFVKEDLGSNYPTETYKINYLEPVGNNKSLEGKIEVKIEYYTIPQEAFKYHFHIIDRALNKSNIDSTNVIVF